MYVYQYSCMPLHLRLFAGDDNGRWADGGDSEQDLAGTRLGLAL
jgi:hypothetical protein